MTSNNYPVRPFVWMLFIFIFSVSVYAQTTAFTYQGKLTDGVNAATGTYQMQFKLYDAVSAGTQIGATITNNTVTVANSVFTVNLDFGSSPFTGADRWLEIGVRKAADPPGFTTLTPRQQLTSSPYSVKTISATSADSLSAVCVGCVTNAQINSVDGSKVTGSTLTNINASNLASGTVADARLTGNVTLQGNSFNAANKLVKLDGTGKLPAIDGSQLTNVTSSAGAPPIAIFPVSGGNTYALGSGANGNSSTRAFFPSLGGGNGSGITIIYTLPPANSYPAGTVLRVSLIDYITTAPTVNFQRTSTTSDLLHGFNQGTGSGGPGFLGPFSSWTTDGVSNWYRGN
jgi:hypothetical protein